MSSFGSTSVVKYLHSCGPRDYLSGGTLSRSTADHQSTCMALTIPVVYYKQYYNCLDEIHAVPVLVYFNLYGFIVALLSFNHNHLQV